VGKVNRIKYQTVCPTPQLYDIHRMLLDRRIVDHVLILDANDFTDSINLDQIPSMVECSDEEEAKGLMMQMRKSPAGQSYATPRPPPGSKLSDFIVLQKIQKMHFLVFVERLLKGTDEQSTVPFSTFSLSIPACKKAVMTGIEPECESLGIEKKAEADESGGWQAMPETTATVRAQWIDAEWR
jgi:hypothetical protein